MESTDKAESKHLESTDSEMSNSDLRHFQLKIVAFKVRFKCVILTLVIEVNCYSRSPKCLSEVTQLFNTLNTLMVFF